MYHYTIIRFTFCLYFCVVFLFTRASVKDKMNDKANGINTNNFRFFPLRELKNINFPTVKYKH